MRLEVVDRIKGVIHDLWPGAEVEIIFNCKTLLFFLIFLRLWTMTIFFPSLLLLKNVICYVASVYYYLTEKGIFFYG